ncbi:Spherulation-specific family 4-domain-containing protein [Mycena galopus ATCC 62051]|nr:Spherulation-specific family 4-domain-containing protein [Mycena galopus ATCC 62051]
MCRYAISILLIQLFVAPCTYALGILLPLYVYPGTNCAAWSPVADAISANSNAQWYIIINPDSGPGPTDELYETCVSQIPASENQVIMGFIDTEGGDVLGDIDTYAGWPSSSRPRGIFFDNISPTASQLSTYQSYVTHAQSQGFTFIGLDPGETVADASYFSIANLINTYESSYSSFNPDSLSGTISQQSVILVNSPATGSYSTFISQLDALGLVAVYITNVADSSQDLPAQLSEFASEVATAGGGTFTGSGSTGNTGSGLTTSSGSPTAPGSTLASTPSGTNSKSGPSSASALFGAPSTSGSGSSTTIGPVSISSSTHSESPPQSAATKNGLQTSSAQAPGSSVPPSDANEPAGAIHNSSPIAAIVGGILGGLIILLILLVMFLCMRRRRRRLASPESVGSFIEIRDATGGETDPVGRFSVCSNGARATPTRSWPVDLKAPLPPEASTSGGDTSSVADGASTTRLSAAPTYGSTAPWRDSESLATNTALADANPSVRASYPTTARLSAAPTYGSAWDSLAGTSGPPPAYHND